MKYAWMVVLLMSGMLQAAGLNFPEMTKNVKAAADAKTVVVDFPFTNQSDKPISITKYEAACSCISVQISGGKMTYGPGESGVVRTNFDVGNFSGEVDKAVVLWVEGDSTERPSVRLNTHIQIPVLVALEPKTVKWDVGGKADPQVIQIQMNDTKPIKILSVEGASASFHQELKTVEEGKRYELKITPTDVAAPAMAIFRILTDCQIERHRSVQAYAVIRKPVTQPDLRLKKEP